MPKSKKDRQFEEDDFFDDCPICQFQKQMDKKGKQSTLKELKEVFKEAGNKGAVVGGPFLDEKGNAEQERKEMEKLGFEYVGDADNFKIPKWMDCTWRRIPCGRDSCSICGKINKHRRELIKKAKTWTQWIPLLKILEKI